MELQSVSYIGEEDWEYVATPVSVTYEITGKKENVEFVFPIVVKLDLKNTNVTFFRSKKALLSSVRLDVLGLLSKLGKHLKKKLKKE